MLLIKYFDINMQRLINTSFRVPQFFFSTATKKKQMELTLRTPYSTE